MITSPPAKRLKTSKDSGQNADDITLQDHFYPSIPYREKPALRTHSSIQTRHLHKTTMSQQQSGKSFRSFLGIPPSNPTPSDSVFVIVDAQNEYDHGLLAVSNVEESRANIGAVLQRYRDAGGDVVHVRHSTPDGAPLFTPGTELADEFEELEPREGEKVCLCFSVCWLEVWEVDEKEG